MNNFLCRNSCSHRIQAAVRKPYAGERGGHLQAQRLGQRRVGREAGEGCVRCRGQERQGQKSIFLWSHQNIFMHRTHDTNTLYNLKNLFKAFLTQQA